MWFLISALLAAWNAMRNVMKTKQITFFLLISTVILSCQNTGQKKDVSQPQEIIPTDTCTNLDYDDGVITHGFDFEDIDTITLKRFVKGSNFTTLLDNYIEKQIFFPITDSARMYRSLSFKQPINNSYDWQIIFSNKMVFNITDMKIKLKPHFITDRSVWWCELDSFNVNGTPNSGGNLFIVKPGFKYNFK